MRPIRWIRPLLLSLAVHFILISIPSGLHVAREKGASPETGSRIEAVLLPSGKLPPIAEPGEAKSKGRMTRPGMHRAQSEKVSRSPIPPHRHVSASRQGPAGVKKAGQPTEAVKGWRSPDDELVYRLELAHAIQASRRCTSGGLCPGSDGELEAWIEPSATGRPPRVSVRRSSGKGFLDADAVELLSRAAQHMQTPPPAALAVALAYGSADPD